MKNLFFIFASIIALFFSSCGYYINENMLYKGEAESTNYDGIHFSVYYDSEKDKLEVLPGDNDFYWYDAVAESSIIVDGMTFAYNTHSGGFAPESMIPKEDIRKNDTLKNGLPCIKNLKFIEVKKGEPVKLIDVRVLNPKTTYSWEHSEHDMVRVMGKKFDLELTFKDGTTVIDENLTIIIDRNNLGKSIY